MDQKVHMMKRRAGSGGIWTLDFSPYSHQSQPLRPSILIYSLGHELDSVIKL